MKENEYQCARCGNIYEKGWTDEEAKDEAKGYFGKPVDKWNGGYTVVCDDCFNKMHPANNSEAVEIAKQQI